MSESAAANAPAFTELWGSVCKLYHSETQDKSTGKQMPGNAASPLRKDLQSPTRRDFSKYTVLNNGDSPGDVEPTQDIVWDPTSPTPTNPGLRNTRVVEISDIANRIAPNDVKHKGTESSLLQWIGDSAIPCTPDIPKLRMRKRSTRQSSVEDLMKLARQFDENMQQDLKASEQFNIVNNHVNECVNTTKCNAKDIKSLSSSDQVEAELHALFDCSTQKVSGRLSQGSAASACSQEVKHQPVPSNSAKPHQSKPKSSNKSSLAAPDEEKGSCGFIDEFDDDWDDDDLLNDSLVLAMTQNLDQQQNIPKTTLQSDTNTNTTLFTSVSKPAAATSSAHQPSNLHSMISSSTLQKLCPTPKTTNRSTFKLESNPHFQTKMATKEGSKSSLPVLQPSHSNKDYKKSDVTASSVKDVADSPWDDGEDDALLFEICDNVESSYSQPQQVSPIHSQDKQEIGLDRQRKTTAPLSIDTTRSTNANGSANRKSSCAFVRSNSLPGTSSTAVSYQGWNIPMKGASNQSGMSQSLPGSRVSLGTFSNCTDSSGTFQAGNVDMKQHTVTAKTHNSSSRHTAFKRNVSDSAFINNKVFVTSQMTGKCSAAEIERKKQEALARRRQRMKNTQNQRGDPP